MSMPNGSDAPITRGQHVAPGPMSFSVTAGYATNPAGGAAARVVKLQMEHATGTSEFIMDAPFASAIGKALIAASTGIEIPK